VGPLAILLELELSGIGAFEAFASFSSMSTSSLSKKFKNSCASYKRKNSKNNQMNVSQIFFFATEPLVDERKLPDETKKPHSAIINWMAYQF
jgi:hypothetical protein